MKIHKLLSTSAATAVLTCAANAQQFFGPWWHDTSVPLSVFASPTGSPSNTGLSPSSPWDLGTAVTQADLLFAANWAATGKGVTINLLPGTYNLTAPVSLPAFGFSVEAFFDTTGTPATITGSFGSGLPLFFFDHDIGFFTSLIVGSSAGMPPSVVRGLTFTNNSTGPAIEIDPSNALSSADTQLISVEVNQCTMTQCTRGVQMLNAAGAKIEYQNVIVDNNIGSCAVGIEAINAWYESDLIRSNRVIGSFNAMRFNGSGGPQASLHPRILSNSMTNSFGVTEGLMLVDCSARVVNNSIGFVTNTSASPAATPSTVHIVSGVAGGAGESIVIVNNILFSPLYIIAGTVVVDPPEIRVTGAFGGTLLIASNDFDSSGSSTLITPAQPVGPGNIPIANPNFLAAPGNLHLTATSPSITNQGNMAFVVPGATATIQLNGQTVPANCALDMDLDPRTHMQSGVLAEVLHRGCDEFIETLARMRTATSGANLQADRFGSVRVPAGTTDAVVDLLIDLPVGSAFSIVLGATLPMGPELQHLQVSPFGSIAIDPTPGNGATMVSGVTTVNPQPVALHLGKVTPAFTEAEMYLQAVLALPNGVIAPSNRLRLDIEDL